MDIFRIIITPQAASDLEGIHAYIAKDSDENAATTARRILAAIDGLKQVPNRTIVHRKGKKPRYPIRSLAVRPYIVHFRVLDVDRVVQITHIRHGARWPPTNLD